MNELETKQACIDYIYGIEKGASLQSMLLSATAKKIFTGAGVGATVGALTAKDSNGDGEVSLGDRMGGAVSGGVLGGATVGAAQAGKSFMNPTININEEAANAAAQRAAAAGAAKATVGAGSGIDVATDTTMSGMKTTNSPGKGIKINIGSEAGDFIDAAYMEVLASFAPKNIMKYADAIDAAYMEVVAEDQSSNPENSHKTKKKKMNSPDQTTRDFPSSQPTLDSEEVHEDLTYEP